MDLEAAMVATATAELTGKQARFVLEYLKDFNATQAAIRAGYAKRSAGNQGSRLMKNDDVRLACARARARLSDKAGIEIEDIVHRLKCIADVDFSDIAYDDNTMKPFDEIPEEARKAIESLEIVELYEWEGKTRVKTGEIRRPKVNDRLKALELLGKHKGMFSDKLELSGDVTITVNTGIEEAPGSLVGAGARGE